MNEFLGEMILGEMILGEMILGDWRPSEYFIWIV